jgi:predicted DNA binding CopG/RHH family protein
MKKIPKFSSEAEERRFWRSADSTEYVDWKKAQRMVFTNLKPSLKTISLRLPESMIEELKLLANKRDVPYQSLLKVFLGERIEQELRSVPYKRAKVCLPARGNHFDLVPISASRRAKAICSSENVFFRKVSPPY